MVRTLRCGRNNPGSNPGHGRFFFSFPFTFLLSKFHGDYCTFFFKGSYSTFGIHILTGNSPITHMHTGSWHTQSHSHRQTHTHIVHTQSHMQSHTQSHTHQPTCACMNVSRGSMRENFLLSWNPLISEW